MFFPVNTPVNLLWFTDRTIECVEIVINVDRDTGINFYLDNQVDGSQRALSGQTMDIVNNFVIGANYGGTQNAYMDIDCAAIFNKVLTEAERSYLWNHGLGTENMKSCARPLFGGSLAGKRGLT